MMIYASGEKFNRNMRFFCPAQNVLC
jgi:hypothetical protein